jgi:hypothetical protein
MFHPDAEVAFELRWSATVVAETLALIARTYALDRQIRQALSDSKDCITSSRALLRRLDAAARPRAGA